MHLTNGFESLQQECLASPIVLNPSEFDWDQQFTSAFQFPCSSETSDLPEQDHWTCNDEQKLPSITAAFNLPKNLFETTIYNDYNDYTTDNFNDEDLDIYLPKDDEQQEDFQAEFDLDLIRTDPTSLNPPDPHQSLLDQSSQQVAVGHLVGYQSILEEANYFANDEANQTVMTREESLQLLDHETTSSDNQSFCEYL